MVDVNAENIELLQDEVDEIEDEFDQSQELSDFQADQVGYSVAEPKEQNNIYTWFWKVVNLMHQGKLAKVGNLNSSEIGEHGISVRECMNLHFLGETFGHARFGEYFENRAKIISATSMSRRGWFMDLSISQRKIRARQRESSPQASEKKFGMFGNKKKKND